MRLTLLHSTARVRLLTASAAAIGALGCATARAQTAPSMSATAFTNDFSEMAKLKSLASQGKGKIGVLLPETTTSARYTSFDEPYLKRRSPRRACRPTTYIITNAQGSESTELTQAQSAITQGATVLLMDPISSGVGASIEILRQVARRAGHRLRSPDARRRSRLLRELQQCRGRQADRPGHGRMHDRLERRRARRSW